MWRGQAIPRLAHSFPAIGRGPHLKMPHRVVDFIRASTNSLENQVSKLNKSTSEAPRRRYSPNRVAKSSKTSVRTSTTLITQADLDDAPAPPYATRPKMADSRASSISSDSRKEHGHHHHHHHRISFPSIHFGRSSKDGHPAAPATLDWQLESPPLVMYGDAETSSGALLSGQLFLNIKEEGLEVESLDASLSIRVTQKKPFANHCVECATQRTELKRWDLLPHLLAMAKGRLGIVFLLFLCSPSPLPPEFLCSLPDSYSRVRS